MGGRWFFGHGSGKFAGLAGLSAMQGNHVVGALS